jgi:hypothetical protein
MSKAQADVQIKPPWLLYICIPVPQLNDLKVFVWTSYHGYLLVPSYDHVVHYGSKNRRKWPMIALMELCTTKRRKNYSTYMVLLTYALGEIIPLKNFEAMFQNKMCP